MEKERKVKKYSVIALIVALLGLTVVYAALSVTLNINATARANKTGISVVFEKIAGTTPSKSNGVVTTIDDPELKQSGTVLNLGDITLNEPGDFYQYSINIVNKGKKAAKITGIDMPNVTELALGYFDISFKYEDGLNVSVGNSINSGASKKVIMRVSLKELTDEEYEAMPDDITLNLNGLTVSFEKDDSSTPSVVENSRVLAPSSIFEGKMWGLDASIFQSGDNANASGMRITFLNEKTKGPNTENEFDVSESQDGSVTLSYVLAQDNYVDVYIGANGGVIAPSDSSYLLPSMIQINNLNYLDTSNVTNMSNMFLGYQGTSLDLSTFNTTNVEDMSYMFLQSSNLKNITFGNGFNTTNVTNMEGMFDELNNIEVLDLSGFNTSSVTTMNHMFVNCSSLTSLNLNNFDTTNVTNMSNMFVGCSGLTSLNLSNFDTSKVENVSSMFSGMTSLTSLDIRNATFESVDFTDSRKYSDAYNNHNENLVVTVKDNDIKSFLQTTYGLSNVVVAN